MRHSILKASPREAVDVTDAAQMLSNPKKPVARSVVYRLIKSGDLEAYRLSTGKTGKLLIYADSIEDFKKRRAVPVNYDRKRILELLAAPDLKP